MSKKTRRQHGQQPEQESAAPAAENPEQLQAESSAEETQVAEQPEQESAAAADGDAKADSAEQSPEVSKDADSSDDESEAVEGEEYSVLYTCPIKGKLYACGDTVVLTDEQAELETKRGKVRKK